MFTRNFELKKDAIFSPLTKTIYSKIVNVSRDRDETMEERPVGRELECLPSGEPKKSHLYEWLYHYLNILLYKLTPELVKG
jgi:hypothetical protein